MITEFSISFYTNSNIKNASSLECSRWKHLFRNCLTVKNILLQFLRKLASKISFIFFEIFGNVSEHYGSCCKIKPISNICLQWLSIYVRVVWCSRCILNSFFEVFISNKINSKRSEDGVGRKTHVAHNACHVNRKLSLCCNNNIYAKSNVCILTLQLILY